VTLQISQPGDFSKVISPFRVEAVVEPGEDGIIELELIGEDGRVISGERLDYSRYLGRRFWIAPTIEFEISGVAETARLIMRTRDELGRVKAISSIDLILLQLGQNEIKTVKVVQEPFIIRYPEAETVITGGAMWVSGLIRRVNPNPLILELVDEQGNVVGMNAIEIPAPNDELSHIPFGIEIFYTVPETTSVLLVVRQESDQRLGGTVALSTIPLTLEP
jgi:hypothetical protein